MGLRFLRPTLLVGLTLVRLDLGVGRLVAARQGAPPWNDAVAHRDGALGPPRPPQALRSA